jgi:UDP-N-acetyl-D-galactosamine dehydrogenase
MSFKISVIGLGYVGLPLAVEFARKYEVCGFDVNEHRIKELRTHLDRTLEVSSGELQKTSMKFSCDISDIKNSNIYIVTVPTPINQYKQPDLFPLMKASETVGNCLKKGDIVIYESTVYPGCTEEDCVPILEKISGLKFNRDFFCGYSPERINPGDKHHTVTKIRKVTSGSTPDVAETVDKLYSSIIEAGTFKASSIKVAEAAKVIENTQRDINIAFVNELSLIFKRMDLDTIEVLEAAGTKWNFLPFRPGLVGGHCIGVDPYYLTFKAEALGYHPQVILAGRRINDSMGFTIARDVVKLMIKKSHKVEGAKVLVLGLTFKENCPDIRNSRVIDIITELKDFSCHVDVYDPWVNAAEVREEMGLEMSPPDVLNRLKDYQAIIFAVAHKQFEEIVVSRNAFSSTVVYDIKGLYPKDLTDARL